MACYSADAAGFLADEPGFDPPHFRVFASRVELLSKLVRELSDHDVWASASAKLDEVGNLWIDVHALSSKRHLFK